MTYNTAATQNIRMHAVGFGRASHDARRKASNKTRARWATRTEAAFDPSLVSRTLSPNYR